MSSLEHHGIKGQKWGVRRFQNPDGTRTSAGKRRDKINRINSKSEDAKSIFRTLSDDDLKMLNYSDSEIKYMRKNDSSPFDYKSSRVAHRVVQKDKNGTPVTYIDATYFSSNSLLTGKQTVKILAIDLATRSGDEYRGKGYAVAAGKKLVKWFDQHGYKDYEYMEWSAKADNIGSQRTAEKLGFKRYEGPLDVDPNWRIYTYDHKVNHSSIGGNMDYIYGNTLVLGDSSYLEHHGILGQKWGIRRFQNKDGSRTAEGKKRYKTMRAVHGAYKEPNYAEKEQHAYDDASKRVFDAVAKADQALQDRFKETDLGKKNPNAIPHIDGYTTGDISSPFSKSIEKQIYDWIRKQDDLREPIREAEEIRSKAESKLRKKVEHTSMRENTNYIYGNTLVLGDPLYLEHHGIKGQRWGVRRFQNKDGSRTAEGKKRYKTLKTASAKKAEFETPFGKAKNKAIDKAKEDRLNMVDDIRYGKNKSKYDDAVDEYDKATMHRYDEYEKEFDKYAAIAGMAGARRWWNDQSDDSLMRGAEFYMYDDGDQSKYNSYDYFLVGKGENPNEVHARLYNATNKIMDLAKADAKEALGEYGNTKEANDFALNIFEYATAASPYSMVNESDGLTYSNDEIAEMRRDIDVYTKEAKRLGLLHMNLTVSEGTLYLAHHGIKGQRWGVRRFQNKDGSLTNAGRKRLGYSTKDVKKAVIKGGKAVGGAAITIGKAGYNLGKKAAAACKAHSEKKKAEKLEKKKEKAAKTRLGVVKNADLFTAAEMAELNKRFKAKDEMTLASLQKGADYFRLAAGMVGAVASINKDFESMTGKSLIPNPVKKEKEKREADERAEDRARKLAKEDAEEDRKRRADERKSRADDIDFKNKSEDLKNKKSEELRKQAAEARAQAKQTWDEAQAAEKTRAMKGVADENEAKAAIKRQELKTNEIAQREEAVAKREAATKSQEEQNEANRKLILNYARDLDTLRDTLNKATNELKNADNVTEQRRKEIWEAIKKAQDDALKHDDTDGLYLEHHGIKGQRWGVRRFQNPDGTLTDKGRKHYQKKLDLEDRKLTAAKAAQGRYERVRTPISVGVAVIGAIAGGLAGSPAGPAGIAAGAAFVSAISGGSTYAEYTVKGMFAGHGANRSKQKIAKYKDMLKQDAFIVEDGTLYLEHFGIKNMKWGVRRFQNKDGSLTEAGKKRYGSGNDEELSGGGGGGGAPEEDEEMKKKIEEAAKKAGMSVAEYRKKMGSKLYDMFGGKYKKEAEKQRNRASAFNNEAQKHAREYDKQKAIAASESRKSDKAETSGDFRKHVNNENVARTKAKTSSARKTEAENARLHSVIDANKAQDKYEKSLAGRYDKFKADRERKDRMKRDKMIEDAFRKETPGRMPSPSKKENVIARASVAAKAAGRVASDVASGKSRPKSAKKVYGDYKNRADVATMQALGKIRSDDEKTMKDGMYKNRQWRARADYAEKRGDKKTAEKYRKMSDDELNRSDYADKEKDIVDMMGDAVYKNYMLRNKKHADNARSARTEQWRNRVAGDRAERQMNTSGAKIKAKLKSGKLPVAEAGQYASAARDRVKAEVGGKLATRKYNKSVNAMGEALASGAKDYINTPKVKKKLTKDQIAANRPVSREKNVKAGKGQVRVGEKHESYAVVNQRRDRRKPMTTHDITLLADHSNEPRTHVLPKMKSIKATAKPMRKLTSKELSKIRSEARVKQLKKDGDYTGEYKKKRRK